HQHGRTLSRSSAGLKSTVLECDAWLVRKQWVSRRSADLIQLEFDRKHAPGGLTLSAERGVAHRVIRTTRLPAVLGADLQRQMVKQGWSLVQRDSDSLAYTALFSKRSPVGDDWLALAWALKGPLPDAVAVHIEFVPRENSSYEMFEALPGRPQPGDSE
ncbi:MAG: hypothetical protein AAFY60_02710, partial [Myxococcota bacterium]